MIVRINEILVLCLFIVAYAVLLLYNIKRRKLGQKIYAFHEYIKRLIDRTIRGRVTS